MTIDHIIKLNGRTYMITAANSISLTIESLTGRKAKYFPKTGKILFRHSITGRFVSKRVNN